MPPPPPRPPPGPPPAPGFSGPPAPRPPPVSAAPTDRSAVLADIQKGARLKKVDRSQIKDRSSPLVGGGAASSGGASDSSASRAGASRGENGPNRAATGGAGPGRVQAPPGLGDIFGGGMPKLKPTGQRTNETKESPPDENRSPPGMSNYQQQQAAKPKPPPAPTMPSQPSPSRVLTSPPSNLLIPPAGQPNLRRSSGSDFDQSPSPKPHPNPKPPVLPSHITSGSATMHIQRSQDRPALNTMTLQKPKHPPPPLPSGPPPTRNISQTMPRPVKHQRPSLPTQQMTGGGSPPSPPPVPGRPPSFRKSDDERPVPAGTRNGPPPPPPPNFRPGQPPLQQVPSSQRNGPPPPPVGGGQRNGPPAPPPPPQTNFGHSQPPAGYPLPPILNGGFPQPSLMVNGGGGSSEGLMSNAAQSRAAPPSRPPMNGGGLGMAQSASVHSLPGSAAASVHPPKRHDSLGTVALEQQVPVLNLANVAAFNQTLARNGMAPSSPSGGGVPKMAPGRPGTGKVTVAQEFEAKFSFHRINDLPAPMPFSGSPKTYPSSRNRAVSRPLAPAPPVQ